MRVPPRNFLVLASFALLVGSCVGNDSPTGPGDGAAVEVGVQPSLIPTPADNDALPVNRIRVSLARVSDGLRLAQTEVDVTATDTEWAVGVVAPAPYSSETAYVFVRLLNVAADGTETVQFSGRSDAVTLVPGEEITPDVPIVRGPVANLFVTGVSITAAPSTMAVGQSQALTATATTSGVDAPTLYWTSLDPAVVSMAGSTATAVAEGMTEVVASAGAFADTATIQVLPLLVITTTALPGAVQNAAYSQALAASGGDGTYAWSVSTGALPAGLTLDAGTGVISGTPTAVEAATFSVAVTSGDGQTATAALSITVADDAPAGFTLTETGGATQVDESGTTDSFDVVLTAQPLTDVVFDVSSADTGEATVGPATLTFTHGDWDTPQTVTVTGVDDAVPDGDQTTAVTVSVNDALSDDAFDPLADQVVSVTTIDDDVSGGPLIQWASGVSGTWGAAANWIPARVPQAGDSVVIDAPGSYTVTLDQSASVQALTVGGVSGVQTFEQTGVVALDVGGTLTVGAQGVYSLLGGSLTAGQASTVAGAFTWSGGTLTLSDTLTVTGQTTLSSASTFGGGTIDVLGAFDWTGGDLTFQNGATLLNEGQMDISADALFQPSGGGTLINRGTLTQNNTGSSFLIDAVNDGTVDVQAGTLNFSGQSPATHSGVFLGGAGAGLGFVGSGAQQIDSTVAGFARVDVATNTTFNGTVTTSWLSVNQTDVAVVNAPLALSDSLTLQGDVILNAGAGATSVPRLRMYYSQASLSGAADLTVTDSLIWDAGSFQGPGARTLAPTSGTRIVNNGNGSPTVDGVTLTNEGAMRWLSNTIFIQNGGTLVNGASGTWSVSHLAPNVFTNTSGFVTNAGMLVKAGATETMHVDVPFTNTGTIDIQVGTLDLNAAFTHADGATLQGSGTVDLTDATPLDLSGDINPGASPGILNLVGASLVQPAASTYNIELGGTTPGTGFDVLNFSGDLSLAGALAVDTTAFSPSAGQQFPVLTVAGGPHAGSFSSVTYPAVAGVAFDTVWTGTTPDTLLVVASSSGPAQLNAWTGAGDGTTWGDPTNWSGGVPTAGDSVVIDLSVANVVMSQDATVQSVTVGAPSGSQQLLTNGFNLVATANVSAVDQGTLTVSAGDTVTVGGAVINQGQLTLRDARIVGPLDNGASLAVEGTTSLTGALTTTASSSILVRATALSPASFTIPTGFTNYGVIDLSDTGANTVTLTVASGTLVNAVGATLRSLQGINNLQRTLSANLDNQGAISVATSTWLVGDALSNSGSIGLSGGLTIQTSGGTFTNQVGAGITLAGNGSVQVEFAGADSFVNLGTIDIGSTGAFSVFGTGNLDLSSGTYTNTGQFNIYGLASVDAPTTYTNTGQITVTQATWNGSSLTNATGGDLRLRVGAVVNADLVVQDTVTIDANTTTTLSGSLVANAPIVSFGAGAIAIDMTGAGTSLEGVLDGPNLTISGTTALSANTSLTGSLIVSGTGSALDVNGQTLVVTGLLRTQAGGAFQMTNALDDVTVVGDAFFSSSVSGTIDDGVLRVSRHFAGDGFMATGNHLTVLNGTADQQEVSFSLGTPGQFANLDVTANVLGIKLYSDASVAGTFTAAQQTIATGGGVAHTLSMSGLVVDGATFDHVLIDYATTLSNGTLSLDNATFQNYGTGDVQISISHPGGTGYGLGGNTFSTVLAGGNLGAYLSVTDTAADGAQINIDISSDPGNGATFTKLSGSDSPGVNWSP